MFHKDGPSFLELTRQALSETTQGYDLLAKKFNYTPFCTPEQLLEPVADILAKGPQIHTMLDLCCGTGSAMLAFRHLCLEKIVGVDLSEGMLEQARKSLSAQTSDNSSLPPFELIQRNALNIDFQQEFDLVTSWGAFGHILPKDQDQFVRGIHNALKPGGRFVFATYLKPSAGSFPWLAARGFNAAMHVRNTLFPQEFIMFYLTFYLERAVDVLSRHNFSLSISAPYQKLDYGRHMRLVTATKQS